jgi:metal-responsive CopG/Arc/MetJ family transcriptional regulator
MRLHITLADAEVRRLDARVGGRRRSRFVATAVQRALDDEQCWESIESAIGSLGDVEHDWDDDPAAWVRSQRRSDGRRVG